MPSSALAAAPAPDRPFVRASVPALFGRALLRRCPHCGGRRIFASFFALRRHCPTCGLRLERGEADYFVGAYLVNLIAVELILFVCVWAFVWVTWPDPPWTLITWVTAVLMLAGCVLCYPFAQTTWLAADLAIRPLTAEELHWHHRGGDLGDGELPQV
jgi:uncharacterized protein (DUF983 family)